MFVIEFLRARGDLVEMVEDKQKKITRRGKNLFELSGCYFNRDTS